MPRLLLTGLSGFLGWNVARLRPVQWQVVGTMSTRCVEIEGVEGVRGRSVVAKRVVTKWGQT